MASAEAAVYQELKNEYKRLTAMTVFCYLTIGTSSYLRALSRAMRGVSANGSEWSYALPLAIIGGIFVTLVFVKLVCSERTVERNKWALRLKSMLDICLYFAFLIRMLGSGMERMERLIAAIN